MRCRLSHFPAIWKREQNLLNLWWKNCVKMFNKENYQKTPTGHPGILRISKDSAWPAMVSQGQWPLMPQGCCPCVRMLRSQGGRIHPDLTRCCMQSKEVLYHMLTLFWRMISWFPFSQVISHWWRLELSPTCLLSSSGTRSAWLRKVPFPLRGTEPIEIPWMWVTQLNFKVISFLLPFVSFFIYYAFQLPVTIC